MPFFYTMHGIYSQLYNSMNWNLKMSIAITPDKESFIKLSTTRMPFGKYKGVPLVDLPEDYLVWFSRKGFPTGNLGDLLQTVYEIKRNGLEYLFHPGQAPTEKGHQR